MKIFSANSILLLIIFFSSCNSGNNTNNLNTRDTEDINMEIEVFDDADRPSFDLNTFNGDSNHTYKFMKPWNYDKDYNSDRKYPIVISLHGYTNSTESYYAPCLVGNDEEMKSYPGFFLAPNNSNKGWGSSAAWVRTLIVNLKETFRIDEDRIYLMGFSMGGSGSYLFANSFYDEHRALFAGIVRLAGQSQTVVRDAIADKTSIWYHIGWDDTPTRVDIAEDAFQFIKNYDGNSGAVENTITDSVDNYNRITKTLVNDGIEIMRKSEYTGVGHSSSVPFHDPKVLEWLFSQSIKKR